MLLREFDPPRHDFKKEADLIRLEYLHRSTLDVLLVVTSLPQELLTVTVGYVDDIDGIDEAAFNRLIAHFLLLRSKAPNICIKARGPEFGVGHRLRGFEYINIPLDSFLEAQCSPSDLEIAEAVHWCLKAPRRRSKRITFRQVIDTRTRTSLKEVTQACNRLTTQSFLEPTFVECNINEDARHFTLSWWKPYWHKLRPHVTQLDTWSSKFDSGVCAVVILVIVAFFLFPVLIALVFVKITQAIYWRCKCGTIELKQTWGWSPGGHVDLSEVIASAPRCVHEFPDEGYRGGD